jgi:WhiB family redox-sensing transcriptional regulator
MYDGERSWRDRAACLGTDPEVFFPLTEYGLSRAQIAQARQICHACPVQWSCLTWALLHGVTEGIWGGTTETERRVMLGEQCSPR